MKHRMLVAAALAGGLAGPVPIADACRIIPIPPPIPGPPPSPPTPPPAPPQLPMETRLHRADITVEGTVARVQIEAVFHNPNPHRIEGLYFFPIEPDAVVRQFALRVNDREWKADLLEAAQARKIYEDIVRQRKDPALLEWVDQRMLQARIFPIEPRSEVRVQLAYSQLVRAEGGLYRLRYPLRSARPERGPVGTLAVRVHLKSDVPFRLFYSPTHSVDVVRSGETELTAGFEQKDASADRNLEIFWTLNREDVDLAVLTHKPSDSDGFFLLSLAPRGRAAPDRIVPRDVVFVFDRSGSMAGDKIRQARNALIHCLGRLNPQDRFAVLAFSTAVDPLTPTLVDATPETVRAAREKIAALEASGGTAIHEALLTALRFLDEPGRLAFVVFLTDGQPTVGPTRPDEILEAVRKANERRARVFVFGVGYDVNTELLDRLALENGGSQDYVVEGEDIEVKVSSFFEKVSEPILSDVSLTAEGVELHDWYPRQIPDLFAGTQVMILGRYRGGGPATVRVAGRGAGGPREWVAPTGFDGKAGADFLPYLWAHRKVAFLLEQIRLHGANRELEQEIVALGRRYGILTPYTSFLVVEDQPAVRERIADYKRAFERGETVGQRAVGFSRALAAERTRAAAPATDRPTVLGFDVGPESTAADLARATGIETFARVTERVRRVADKVFIQGPDGVYYDTELEESQKAQAMVITRYSEEFFELLRRHPGIGRYLAEPGEVVIVIEGRAYKIVGERQT